MDEQRAQRTLVKSPPELWAEISDLDALSRHLGEFGEISITRSEPETAVAWEGDRARGTVELEPAGWGTRVTLTAVPVGRPAAAEPQGEPEPEAEPEPDPEPEPEADAAVTRRGLWARLVARFRPPDPDPRAGEPAPDAEEQPPPDADAYDTDDAEPATRAAAGAADPARTAAILVGVLDDLGAARHRPFSRMG